MPESNKLDVAYIIGSVTPGFKKVKETLNEDPPNTTEIIDAFIENLDSPTRGTPSEIGMVVCIRSAVDFFIIRPKTKNEIKSREDAMNYIAERDGSEEFKKLADQQEFRSAQWNKIYEDWAIMREHDISDLAIKDYNDRLTASYASF